jgi:hypothetical protein
MDKTDVLNKQMHGASNSAIISQAFRPYLLDPICTQCKVRSKCRTSRLLGCTGIQGRRVSRRSTCFDTAFSKDSESLMKNHSFRCILKNIVAWGLKPSTRATTLSPEPTPIQGLPPMTYKSKPSERHHKLKIQRILEDTIRRVRCIK